MAATPDSTEAIRIASFVVLSNASLENASPAMKIAIVKPIPATIPTTQTPRHDTPLGRAQSPRRTVR